MQQVIYAFGLALAVSLFCGPLLIPALHKLKFGQYIRDDGPQSHMKKAGTPTMGGLLFLAGITVATLAFGEKSPQVMVVLSTTLGFGLIGFADDFIKIVLKRPLGLRAREKLAAQLLLAGLLTVTAVFWLDRGTGLVVPFTGQVFDLGVAFYVVFTTLIVVGGTVNAVNITDGLDGLAAGVTVFAGLAYMLISLMMGPPVDGVAVFGAALVGGCTGFLRYNIHPARVFMGDTGSLALGGAVAAMAVVTRTELFIPVIGGIYLVEILSVIIQVISFRLTGKRVFRMSPLHHHFELSGWRETKVVRVFWLVSLGLAVIGVLGMRNIG